MAHIIDDQLPGGPQWIEHLGHDPVWVETKSQLKAEMDRLGLETFVRTDKTPQPKSDDPRFSKNGLRALLSTRGPNDVIHTQSGLVAGKDTRTISRERMAVLAQAWDVLCDPINGLGYQVVCPRCTQLFGEGQDGVRAENSPIAGRLVLECGCTVHVYEQR